jgi:NAD(P)-dependent dehydrogenase (short-subunit alcohol dehydrogenase family)
MAKTILITGASTGIGRATALYFAAKGWNVVATMRDPGKADAALQHPQITLLALDVTNQATIDEALKDALNRFQKIDVLLNNAGYGLFGPLEAVSNQQLQQQFGTNVFGLINVTRAVLPSMRAAGQGLIINVASIGGRMAFPYSSSYIATKFAVEGLSESLRFELAPFNIRVKVIEPGGINTDFGTRSMQTAVSDPYRAGMTRMMGMFAKLNAKLPQPEPVAKAIYRAATDTGNRLRYPAKSGGAFIARRILPDVLWRWILTKAMVR